MPKLLSDDDERFLREAVAVSRRALTDEGKTPFGALVVVGGDVVGTGTSSVVERCDPTAHAEVMALREAGRRLGRHLLEDAVLYSSSEPCPMCLAACYWARIPRLVFGATSFDVAAHGFEDLRLYRQLATPLADRALAEVPARDELRGPAVEVLRLWAEASEGPLVPKF